MKNLVFIFDGDGVTIHPWRFSEYLKNECGIHPNTTNSFFTGPFQDCMRGKAELKTELEPRLEGWGWAAGYDSFLENWLALENAPNHEVLELVTSLRDGGNPCHLGSNQDKSRARYIEDEMGFKKYFDQCFFSTDLGAVKPQLDFFEQITNHLGVDPCNVVFFDDSLGHVTAAQEFGWQAHQATEKTHIVSVLNELGL